MTVVDPLDYRTVIGGFATGVTVITATHRDEPFGMTANSVTSVSLEPTLLLVCFIRGSQTGIAVKEAGRFGVNILSANQQALAEHFAITTGGFGDIGYSASSDEIPVLSGTLGAIGCRVREVIDGGDHEIILGEVQWCHSGAGEPLLFFRGRYFEGGRIP